LGGEGKFWGFLIIFFFVFLKGSVTWFRLGSPPRSYRKDHGNRKKILPLFHFFLKPHPLYFMRVVLSRADLNEISDWHLADLNPSWLNLCNTAVLGIYPRADINLAI